MIMDPGLADRPADTQSEYAKLIEPGAARWSELSSGETA